VKRFSKLYPVARNCDRYQENRDGRRVPSKKLRGSGDVIF
jgi:hypothetical protein